VASRAVGAFARQPSLIALISSLSALSGVTKAVAAGQAPTLKGWLTRIGKMAQACRDHYKVIQPNKYKKRFYCVSFEVNAQEKMRDNLYSAGSIVIAGGGCGTDMHALFGVFAVHHTSVVTGRR
jgi:hypothetical protein